MLQKMRGNKQEGFTLIELMIVIAIIGILSAIAIPNFLSYRQKGKDSAAKSEASNFYLSTMAHYADTGTGSPFSPDGSGGTKPAGFAVNPAIAFTGDIAISTAGLTTSMVSFQHSDGGQLYVLNAATGYTDP